MTLFLCSDFYVFLINTTNTELTILNYEYISCTIMRFKIKYFIYKLSLFVMLL